MKNWDKSYFSYAKNTEYLNICIYQEVQELHNGDWVQDKQIIRY